MYQIKQFASYPLLHKKVIFIFLFSVLTCSFIIFPCYYAKTFREFKLSILWRQIQFHNFLLFHNVLSIAAVQSDTCTLIVKFNVIFKKAIENWRIKNLPINHKDLNSTLIIKYLFIKRHRRHLIISSDFCYNVIL